MKGILAIGAHPDDIELGCGGTLAKYIAAGVPVKALVLCNGEEGKGEEDSRSRREETIAALSHLGLQPHDIWVMEFADTKFHTQLPELIEAIEHTITLSSFPIDRVYTMFKEDRHQDHRAVYEASIVACRKVPQILCYETPSAWPNFEPVVFEPIPEPLFVRKIEAIQMHKTQAHRTYMQPEALTCSAQFRGMQHGIGPSEGFMVHKMVMV